MGAARPRVYVDVDDVLCKTAQVAAATVQCLFGITRSFEALHSFSLEVSFGLSPDQLETLLAYLNSGPGLLGIPPRAGAVDCLRRWSERLDVCVVTGRDPKHWRATAQWLEQEGMIYHRLLFANKYGRFDVEDMASGADIVSTDELAALDFAFAVEDSADFSAVLAASGVPVLLMDRPWNRATDINRSHTSVKRCADWREVEQRGRALLAAAE